MLTNLSNVYNEILLYEITPYNLNKDNYNNILQYIFCCSDQLPSRKFHKELFFIYCLLKKRIKMNTENGSNLKLEINILMMKFKYLKDLNI